MKTFFAIRELTGRKPEGKKVFDKKMKGIRVMIHKERNGFVTYIDGDRLDVYKTQKEAEKAASEFMKQYKGMK